jgi:hypothetical protein
VSGHDYAHGEVGTPRYARCIAKKNPRIFFLDMEVTK